jgi:hypothetical protein
MVDDYYYALEFVHASVVRVRVLAYVCCAQQTGMHRMDGSNCLIPCHTYG